MNRLRTASTADPSTAELADLEDLRSVISRALATTPVDDRALRRGVWTYVGAARRAGTSPGNVVIALTELVGAARKATTAVHQALIRRVMLWCVEAYFGHLGGEAVAR